MNDTTSRAAGAPTQVPARPDTGGDATLFDPGAGGFTPFPVGAGITFDVVGLPAPQGSKSAIVVAGRARLIEGKGDQRRRHADWRTAVALAARSMADELGVAPIDTAVALRIVFRFPMPKSRPKRDRERGAVIKSTAPDLDKLVRAVGDGLQAGGLLSDDARIAKLQASKCEVVGWTGAEITIRRLT